MGSKEMRAKYPQKGSKLVLI